MHAIRSFSVIFGITLLCLVLIRYYSLKINLDNSELEEIENILELDDENGFFESKFFNRQIVDDNEISLIPIKSRLAIVK